MVLIQTNLSLAENTFVNTTYDDSDWALATSDILLRDDVCTPTGEPAYYEKVFDPCYGTQFNSYWKLTSSAKTGRAITLLELKGGFDSIDSLYVREGFEFRLYSEYPNDPASEWMGGPQYVSLSIWENMTLEPGTFIVEGSQGDLEDYSIIVNLIPRVSKVDDIIPNDCVVPNDVITYTICYTPGERDATDVVIIDTLPIGVEVVDADPTGEYTDPPVHTYTWDDITVNSNDPEECLELTVRVTDLAEPCSLLINEVKIESDEFNDYFATEETPTCCFGGDTIFVDAWATGSNAGTSWTNAYTDLQDALARTVKDCGDEIWVADGEYAPVDGNDVDASFELVDGVEVYGGFDGGVGGESSLEDRDWWTNEAILSGEIADNPDSWYVVTNVGTVDTVLDGFTITGGATAGVYCNEASGLIEHNIITGNGTGVYLKDDAGSVVRNNFVYANVGDGVYVDDDDTTVGSVDLRNNTVANNGGVGINSVGTVAAEVNSCIVWGNTTSSLYGCSATYSCFNGATPGAPDYNIGSDPDFVDGYHISQGSLCIDAGDLNLIVDGEVDIDKQFRILDGDGDDDLRVDIGADEYCGEVSPNADYNVDGIVDYGDFVKLSSDWLEVSLLHDLTGDDYVDADDLAVFVREWLWMDCEVMKDWAMLGGESMMMGEGLSVESAVAVEAMSVEEEILVMESMIEFIENLWHEDKELRENTSMQELKEFIAKIEGAILELEDSL